MKRVQYLLEAGFLKFILFIFSLLPAETASNIGGALAGFIGPKIGASGKALKNLQRALPEAASAQTIKAMWVHLGRIIAEYPHLEALSRETEVVGMEHLKAALDGENGAIFFGAHLGNWELNAAVVLTQCGVAPDLTYRVPNNPYVDKMLMKARSVGGQISGHSKSSAGGKGLIKALKAGHCAGILIDQKYNEGVSIPFFGMEAMTNPVFVQLAQKYKCALVPIRNERLEGIKFRLNIYEPLKVFEADGSSRPVEDVIKDAHSLLEGWIIERPEQWLWLHRRWKHT